VTSWLGRFRGRLAVEIVLASTAGVAAFVLAARVNAIARSHVPGLVLGPLLLVVVLVVARFAGILYALPVGVATVLAFDWYFLPPLRDLDAATVLVLGLFLGTSVIVGAFATTTSRRAIASEQARGAIAEEQAALRRVATLVAQAGPPSVVFEAVTREVGLLCNADVARMERYEADGVVTGVAAWSRAPGQFTELAVGTRFTLDGLSIARGIQQTGAPVRVDGFGTDTGEIAREARAVGIRSSIGCPIVVGGRLWGVIAASRRIEEPFPADTEAQIARFTELVATAIANAEARAELTASRARIVATADETRRRIERDLHDGAQQRLVSLALRLRTAAAAILPEEAVQQELAGIGSELDDALDDLRELSRGIHPAILSEGGLGPALRTLARRSSVPVELQMGTKGRLPERIEVAAYYVVAEALANVAKHAGASVVQVDVDADDGLLRLAIRDDGVGGADPARGSGLVGLKDRVEATGGTLRVESRRGQGTRLLVELPADPSQPMSPT
jgi:signal transduction histidine kinase